MNRELLTLYEVMTVLRHCKIVFLHVNRTFSNNHAIRRMIAPLKRKQYANKWRGFLKSLR